jgi:phage terminase large subunit-like protein
VPAAASAGRRKPPSTGASWPPRWLSPVPAGEVERGDGEHAARFVEAFCRATEDSIAADAGELLRLRDWQANLFRGLLARRRDGRYRHRKGLVGVARKNTKSTLGGCLALYGLVSDYPGGPQGREVYSCAGDRLQAGIVFDTAKRMIELEPELKAITRVYRDAIEVPKTGSIYRALSAEAYSKEGLNPTLVIFDEVHVQPNRELWDVMALASGARREPLMVGISTAGAIFERATGRESLCYQLYQYGVQVATGEVKDPTFYFAWWEPRDPSADHREQATWQQGNPGFGDLVSAEDFRAALLTTPESEFRTKRCNQWVVAMPEAFLPVGTWEACEGGSLDRKVSIVLSFDGSFNNDCTGIVATSVQEVPHVAVVELWEKPPADADPDWRVDILQVEQAIREVCRSWTVLEICCDPFRWARTFQVLEDEGLPVVEFPQSPARMTPATQHFYEAVLNQLLTHAADARLARHLANAVLRNDSRGMRIYKEHRNSKRHIDLAVAALMGHERARWHLANGSHEPLVAWGTA